MLALKLLHVETGDNIPGLKLTLGYCSLRQVMRRAGLASEFTNGVTLGRPFHLFES